MRGGRFELLRQKIVNISIRSSQIAGLPVDAHEKVGEETFVETQLPALLHVRKTEEGEKDNQNDNLMIKMIHINVCMILVKLINTVHPGQCNTIIMPIKRVGSNLTKGHLNK